MKKILFCFLSCFVCAAANARDLPEWVLKTPRPGGSYHYFVGSGTEETKAQAIQNAEKAARDDVLMYLGAEVQSETFLRETSTSLNSDSRVNVSSYVNLKGFEKDSVYCEKENKKYSCYVLMRYPLKELEQERKRLETRQGKEDSFQYNVVGNDTRRGTLIVDTGNVQADLYINGEKTGRTPLKLVGQLEPDKEYEIKIDSEAHEIYKAKVYIQKNVVTKIEPPLTPAYAKVAFEPDPDVEGAVLKINGIEKKVGKKYELPAGKIVRVEISHPKYSAVTSEHVFKRNENKTVKLSLSEKTAVLTLIVSKPEYKIEIDGKVNESREKERRIELASGKHTITVYAENVKPVSDTFSLAAAGKERMEINDEFFAARNGGDEEKDYRSLPAVFVPYGKTRKIDGNFNPRQVFENADFSYLVPKLAYDTRSGAVRFIVKILIDKDEYEKSYVAPLKKTLLKASYSSSKAKKDDLKLRCVKDDLPYLACGVKPVEDVASAYIRTGEPVEKLFSREAPFSIIKDIPNWAAGDENVPVTRLEAFFTLFDKGGKGMASFTVPFVLIPYQVVGNMYVFSPMMAAPDAFECGSGRGGRFKCGTTVFKSVTGKVHIDLNDVKDIYISIGASK